MNTAALTKPKTNEEPYLKFQLNSQIAALFAMRHVQEVLILPARRLTPMPNMPPCMLGLANRRSRVVWVIDLAQLLGLATVNTHLQPYNLQYKLMMMQVGTAPFALAVQHVKGITWVQPDDLQSPIGRVPASFVPYLRGCVLQRQQQHQEVVLVLDAEAIVQSPIFHQTDSSL
ncbi:MAG: purine-binding chemotaxis protein CheW [Leptolyngbyaceae cyanobacterium SL_7_1]|nr:purine-binding chemotaxis protein CheW [Leptolyngbyaceae cyanobacterium SL_7_1]